MISTIITSYMKKSWNYFFILFVNGDIVIYDDIFPCIVLVYFYIVYAVLIEGLALEHFL
jgi:hypothetical protein